MKDLAVYIVWGIAIFATGAFFSALINLSRYNTSTNAQSYFKALKMEPCEEKKDGIKHNGIRFHAWQNITLFCQVMSYASFILGISVVVIGALVLLTGK